MHELALVKKIVDNAEAAAKKAGLKRVASLRMRIGKMSGTAPDQLAFLFETYEKGGPITNARLKVEEIPVELECPECKHTFIDERFNDHDFAHTVSHAPLAYQPPHCPKCHADGPEVIRGKELELVDMEGE